MRTVRARIAELPVDRRHPVEENYRRAKIFIALGVAVVLVPFWLLIALTPDSGVPSQSHVLPLELYFACVALGAVLLGIGIVSMARVSRELDR